MSDARQRRLGVARHAAELAETLPHGQRADLSAFATGVSTAGLSWSVADSIAIGLLFAQELSTDGTDVLAARTIRENLPESVSDLLMSDADPYATDLLGAPLRRQPGLTEAQRRDLRSLMAAAGSASPAKRIPITESAPWGSNVWASVDSGGAVLANDLHLPLTHPVLLRPVRLVVAGRTVAGFVMVGVPVVVAGTNGLLAWGVTRLAGHTVKVEEVRPVGEMQDERIAVDGGPDHITQWWRTAQGTAARLRNGTALVDRWAVLAPGGFDIGLGQLVRCQSVTEALDVAASAAGPSLNIVMADAGRIGWTPSGAQWDNSADGLRGAAGRPRVSRQTGLLVNANNATPHHFYEDGTPVGRNHFPAVRARRIADVLTGRLGGAEANDPNADPLAESLRLQLDDDATFYMFYRDLLARVLAGADVLPPDLRAALAAAEAWDGRSHPDSAGLPFLAIYRECLRDALFGPLLEACARADPDFSYAWHNYEHALRLLIEAEIIPPPFRDRASFHRAQAGLAATLLRTLTGSAPDEVTWGSMSAVGLLHTEAAHVRGEDRVVPGCAEAVRSHRPGFGAAIRLVIRLKPTGPAQVAWQLAGRLHEDRDDALLTNWADGVPSHINVEVEDEVVK